MIARGDLPVAHRIGRLIRVSASSVTAYLAGSVPSPANEALAMNNNTNGEPEKGAPRLFRQRGRSRVWTALLNNEEVPLGTNSEVEAKKKVAAMAGDASSAGARNDLTKSPWRLQPRPDRGGFAVTYYDAKGERRFHRIPMSLGPGDRCRADVRVRGRGLELVEKVQAALPPVSGTFSRASRRQILQAIHRILVLAVYPAKVIAANPLPKGFLPKADSNKAKTYLYPDEDAKLMACKDVCTDADRAHAPEILRVRQVPLEVRLSASAFSSAKASASPSSSG